jgi:hypothetical protein
MSKSIIEDTKKIMRKLPFFGLYHILFKFKHVYFTDEEIHGFF